MRVFASTQRESRCVFREHVFTLLLAFSFSPVIILESISEGQVWQKVQFYLYRTFQGKYKMLHNQKVTYKQV